MSSTRDPERHDDPLRGRPSRVTFDRFELDLGTGELTRDGQFVTMQAQVAKALVHLVRNAGRLVPRQQLIELLWPDRIVEYDQGLNSIVRTLRTIFGDDAQKPRYIETLPRQGYRFIAPLASTPPLVSTARADAPRRFGRTALVASAALIAVLLLGSLYLADSRRSRTNEPPSGEPSGAIAVLPLRIHAPEQSDVEWVRFGAMDAISERLRESGVAATPSETVISTLHASVSEEAPETERLRAVRTALGVGMVVDGEARQESEGWTIELVATSAGGERRRVVSGPSEVIAAAVRAADLLLAALGQPVPASRYENEELSEVLQRARAATLALELDTARSILAAAAQPLRDEPELRHQLAWIEYRAGRFDEAVTLATALIESPALAAQPRLLAKSLVVRGLATGARDEDWAAGMHDLNAAVVVLGDEDWAPELATALAARGVARVAMLDFEGAAEDLGQARVQYDAAADPVGMVRVDNHFGYLELKRWRPAAALPYFERAIALSESLGYVDALRGNLFGLWSAQTLLLRWHDALVTSERLLALRGRIQDPARRHGIGVARATVLTAFGRLDDAQAILDRLRESERDGSPFIAFRGERARAYLAWQRSDAEDTLDTASRALRLWLTGGSAVEPPTDIALLHQRASIAASRPVAASQTLVDALDVPGSRETGEEIGFLEASPESRLEDDPAYLVGAAEWAAFNGDHEAAERLFRAALENAEARTVPAFFVPVADAYARWLLDRGRVREAATLAGRVAAWADQDYDSALLQVAVLRAGGQRQALDEALRRAQSLAGERELPAAP